MQGEASRIRRIAAVFVFILSVTAGAAAAQSTLTGHVVDNHGAAVEMANVQLMRAADSTLAAGTITDATGTFVVEAITQGDYRLFVSLIGFTDYVSETLAINGLNNVQLDTVVLTQRAYEMEGVAVEARRALYEQKGDRLVINVGTSLTLAGQSALEVLKRSPGVIVNEQSGTVALVGKTGVQIMMNGKRSYIPAEGLVQYLAAISADNVESIELIMSPPASMDAEGNAGFINIVLKTSPDAGLNGSISVSGGYGQGEMANASGNISFERNRLSLSGNYSFMLNGRRQHLTTSRRINTNDAVLFTSTTSRRDPWERDHDVRLAVDYELDEETTIGGLAGAYTHRWTMDALNNMLDFRNDAPMTRISIANDEINHWRHAMGSVYVHREIGSGSSLRADLDYVYYHDNNPTNYYNTTTNLATGGVTEEQQSSGKITPLKIIVAKADYETSPTAKWSVSAGVKGSFSRFTNRSSFQGHVSHDWLSDAGLGSTSILREDVLASYGSTEYRFREGVSLTAGLRYEFTSSNLRSDDEKDLVDRRFGSLFPSVAYTHQLAENVKMGAAYTRRITRPSFTDMAPFLYFIDPNTFFTGNAGLQPAMIQTFKIDFTYRSLLASMEYSWEDSTISQFQSRILAEENVQLLFPRNYSKSNSATALVALPIHPTGWWSTQNNVMLVWSRLSDFSESNDVEVARTSFLLNSTQNFSLPYNFDLEISGFYQGAAQAGQYRFAPVWGSDMALQYSVPRNNGTLSLAVSDVFNSLKYRFTARETNDLYYLVAALRFADRTVRLTYSLRFGDGESRTQRSTASSEEQGRVQ